MPETVDLWDQERNFDIPVQSFLIQRPLHNFEGLDNDFQSLLKSGRVMGIAGKHDTVVGDDSTLKKLLLVQCAQLSQSQRVSLGEGQGKTERRPCHGRRQVQGPAQLVDFVFEARAETPYVIDYRLRAVNRQGFFGRSKGISFILVGRPIKRSRHGPGKDLASSRQGRNGAPAPNAFPKQARSGNTPVAF